MKKLIFVPVIHMGADLGSIAEKAAERGISGVGEDIWQMHTKTILGFWQSIAGYFETFDARGVKLYQDGMIADKELGARIIEDGIKAGSINFRILSDLLQRGAVLVRTEDFKLVKQEHDWFIKLSKARTKIEKIIVYLRYRLIKGKLLKKRDKYVAMRINGTLKKNETGVLFIGANHDVERWLDKDIGIVELKDKKKLMEYQRGFIHWDRRREKFDKLAGYLTLPVCLAN